MIDFPEMQPLSPQMLALRRARRYAREVTERAETEAIANISELPLRASRPYMTAGDLWDEEASAGYRRARAARDVYYFDRRRRNSGAVSRSDRYRTLNELNESASAVRRRVRLREYARRTRSRERDMRVAHRRHPQREASRASDWITPMRIEIARVEGPSAPESVLTTDRHMQHIQRIPNVFASDEPPVDPPPPTSGLDTLAEAAVTVYRQDILAADDSSWPSAPLQSDLSVGSFADLVTSESTQNSQSLPSVIAESLDVSADGARPATTVNITSEVSQQQYTNLRDLDPQSEVAMEVSAALSVNRSATDSGSLRSVGNDDLESIDSTLATIGSPTPSNFSELLETADDARPTLLTAPQNQTQLSAPSRGSVETELESYRQNRALSSPLPDIPEVHANADVSRETGAMPVLHDVRTSSTANRVTVEASPPMLSAATVASSAHVVLPQVQRPMRSEASSPAPVVSQTLQRSLMTLLEQPADATPQLQHGTTNCSVTEVPQPVTSIPPASTPRAQGSRRRYMLPPPFSVRSGSLREDLAALNASESSEPCGRQTAQRRSEHSSCRCVVCQRPLSNANTHQPRERARFSPLNTSRRMPRPRLRFNPTRRNRLSGQSDNNVVRATSPQPPPAPVPSQFDEREGEGSWNLNHFHSPSSTQDSVARTMRRVRPARGLFTSWQNSEPNPCKLCVSVLLP